MALGQAVTQFKFKWIAEDGSEEGFLRKKGSFDGNTLTLDDAQIPADSILSLETRGNRAIFTIHTGESEPSVCAIAVSGISARRLKGVVDISRSASWAKAEKEDLNQRGQGHLYHETQCRHCNAIITLSRMQITPQLYCSFCDTLTTIKDAQPAPSTEKSLRICDECGMFSKPKKFTIFYFYFLFVIYGFRQNTTWRCPGCMRGEAWKMLFGNLIFILGVPVAIVQLIRSYGGSVTGKFAGLDKANILARKGKTAQALAQYREILKRVPVSAGLNYNIGFGLLETKPELAMDSFERALTNCANYTPAAQLLAHCYTKLGNTEKLRQLQYTWDMSPETDDAHHQTTTQNPGSE